MLLITTTAQSGAARRAQGRYSAGGGPWNARQQGLRSVAGLDALLVLGRSNPCPSSLPRWRPPNHRRGRHDAQAAPSAAGPRPKDRNCAASVLFLLPNHTLAAHLPSDSSVKCPKMTRFQPSPISPYLPPLSFRNTSKLARLLLLPDCPGCLALIVAPIYFPSASSS